MGTDQTLEVRYKYGDLNPYWTSVGQLSREEELLELARAQTRLLGESNEWLQQSGAYAESIAAEISWQSDVLAEGIGILDSSISREGRRISRAVDRQGELVTQAVVFLQESLVARLDAVVWELEQIGETLGGILAVLRENRQNEARQLVSQGLRLMYADYVDDAHERFVNALSFDKTDYQVLKNLGFIAISRGDAETAHEYFERALRLPFEMFESDRVSTLRVIARLHHTEGQFEGAASVASELCTSPLRSGRDLLDWAAYLCRSGADDASALRLVRQAVEDSPTCFHLAAVGRDFRRLQSEVLSELADAAADYQNAVLQFVSSQSVALRGLLEISPGDEVFLGYATTLRACSNTLKTTPFSVLWSIRTYADNDSRLNERSQEYARAVADWEAAQAVREQAEEALGAALRSHFEALRGPDLDAAASVRADPGPTVMIALAAFLVVASFIVLSVGGEISGVVVPSVLALATLVVVWHRADANMKARVEARRREVSRNAVEKEHAELEVQHAQETKGWVLEHLIETQRAAIVALEAVYEEIHRSTAALKGV
jgi:tetratricopeptide (TPR) repeat protein